MKRPESVERVVARYIADSRTTWARHDTKLAALEARQRLIARGLWGIFGTALTAGFFLGVASVLTARSLGWLP